MLFWTAMLSRNTLMLELLAPGMSVGQVAAALKMTADELEELLKETS